ncbi:hypothetical protein Airi01_085730 [Actinoallomurus iriomotensis]|uniref:Uncharacterized protein n=1 Tax=Actinoallomurus iriomotensis TaxID=478107 RepID=A0A9W6RPY3_9ACTN|nr:hypothetical protein Airi01_085730 [Actinoallomurus iriomotensis]
MDRAPPSSADGDAQFWIPDPGDVSEDGARSSFGRAAATRRGRSSRPRFRSGGRVPVPALLTGPAFREVTTPPGPGRRLGGAGRV